METQQKITPEESFNPEEMQKIVERLKAQGRLPNQDAFVQQMGRLRGKYRPMMSVLTPKTSPPAVEK